MMLFHAVSSKIKKSDAATEFEGRTHAYKKEPVAKESDIHPN
jgi:hypothetical protein